MTTQTEALKRIAAYPFSRAEELSVEQMREIAREALAQPEQEPVAHVCVFPLRGDEFFPQTRIEWKNGRPVAGPLYTTPPQRTWVGLTKKEVHDLFHPDFEIFHQRIEAKLKEKNT